MAAGNRHREFRNIVLIAADARESFHMTIPGSHIGIPDWPVDPISKAGGRSKGKIAPALTGSTPHDGFTTDLVTPDPVERFFLNIRMLLVFHKKMRGVFGKCVAFRNHRIFFDQFLQASGPGAQIPNRRGSCRVIFYVFDISAPFQHKCFQPMIAQFLGRPSATDTGSDNDGVVWFFSFRRAWCLFRLY